MARKKPKVGDYIVFTAATRWGSCKPVKRKVLDIDYEGRPLVRYGGWDNFIVYPKEISEVIR